MLASVKAKAKKDLPGRNKMPLLLLQHCQTFLNAHATRFMKKFFLKIQLVTNYQDLVIKQIICDVKCLKTPAAGRV